MALLFGGYLLTVSYHQIPSIKIPHVYSKHCCFSDLVFACHHKAILSNVTSNKNYISSRAKLKDEPDHIHHQLLPDLAHDAVSKHQLLHTTPLSSTPFSASDSRVSNESCLRVAHQGIRGAYSESAAEKAYPKFETIPCQQFDTAFEAVQRSLVDRAVLPIENSLGGSIHRNYDLLLCHNLHIVGEVKLAVAHCLLAKNGIKLEDLKGVLSHPQALAQCEKTLTELGLVGVRDAMDNTAVAAKQVAVQKLNDTAAIASTSAAVIYGLNILARNIQVYTDDCNNVTRFLVLAREPLSPGTDRPFKTPIVFSLKEGPSMLSEALSIFTLQQIDILKIESRPYRNQPLQASTDNNSKANGYFNYIVYADFEASMADQRTTNAVRHLKEFATFLRVLGSYPIDTSLIYE